jgi:hypothetical protein
MKYPIVISLLLVAFSGNAAQNLLRNSSFEVGGRTGWGWEETDEVDTSIATATSTTYAQHGVNSLRIDILTGVVGINSYPIRLKTNTQYTLSAYGRHSASSANMSLYARDVLAGTSTTSFGSVGSGGFTRVSHTFTTSTNAANCWISVKIDSASGAIPYLYVDAVQLEEGGSATTYAPMADVEIGLGLNASYPGNVFFDTETPIVPLRLYNNTGSTVTSRVDLAVLDIFGTNRLSSSLTLTLPTGATSTNYDTTLATAKRGYSPEGWPPSRSFSA